MAEFMLVAMNQVVNEAPRFRYMTGGQVKVPLVLKAGYGFTAGWAGQHTGSIYDVVPAAKQANRAIGEWNRMRIVARGRKVTIELNGEKLVDADLDEHKAKFDKHPGLTRKSGHLGLQSYNVRVDFRSLLVKPL